MALVLDKEGEELYLSLNREVRREIDKQVVAMSKQIRNALTKLTASVDDYVEARPALPVRRLLRQLEDIQLGGAGMFQDASAGISKAMSGKTISISEDVFFSGLTSEADYDRGKDTLMWTAMFVNTCPDCLGLHGLTRTWSYWEETGQPNVRDTVCTIRGECHCILVPSEVMPSRADMRKPIKMHSARIRRAEKVRGRRYKRSTKTGFLGQINNPKSTINKDLRKLKRVKRGKKF